MAGSINFEITPLHIYQRKFNTADLEAALRFSHIYIVSRRPATRIRRISATGDSVHVSFTRLESPGGKPIGHSYRIRFRKTTNLSARSHENGEYFSIIFNDKVFHGDSWSLLSCLSNAKAEIALHEVLYIGMAFGKDGERNVSHRIKEHETLQRIYEEHAGSDWDIFVTPIEINGHSMLTNDHIEDQEYGPSITLYLQHFAQPSPLMESRSKPSKESVELIEHGLISVFRPPYNGLLLEWNPAKPTDSMKVARAVGFRLMTILLLSWHGLARFISATDSVGQRTNMFTFPLSRHPHPGPRGDVPRDDWGIISDLQEQIRFMIKESDKNEGVLTVFGPKAPAIRRPPQINL